MFIVALPFGVLHGGYWAILAMVGIAHICCHTGKILVECLYEKNEATGEVEKVRFSYKELAQVSDWNSSARKICEMPFLIFANQGSGLLLLHIGTQ